MKRKIIFAALTALLALMLCGSTLAEEVTIVASGTCGANGGNLTWTLDSEGTLTIEGEGEMTDSFAYGTAYWYSCRDAITSLVIGDGVTSIGRYAFCDFTNLTSVSFPDGITYVGIYAFFGCNSVTDVYAESLDGWLRISFSNDSSNPMSYADNLYLGGERAVDIAISDGVSFIGKYAFLHCRSLTSVAIPGGVTYIGSSAFAGCWGLTCVGLPDSVTSIGSNAFNGCIGLESISIPDGVTSIGGRSFYKCSSLTGVTIPDSVTSIGEYAFAYCDNLKLLTILGADMPVIGEMVFCDTFPIVCCYKNTAAAAWAKENGYDVIYIDGAPGDDLGEIVLALTLPADVTVIEAEAFVNVDAEKVVVPDGCVSIGSRAFAECEKLILIEIPETVTEIAADAFENSSGVTVSAPSGSPAEAYANAAGIPFVAE